MPPKKSAGFGLANPRGARKSAGNSRSVQEAAAAAPAADRPGTAVGDDESKFLVEAADRALAGAGYRVGAAVEYNSATLGGWAAATVTKVWAGGTVDVQTDEGLDIGHDPGLFAAAADAAVARDPGEDLNICSLARIRNPAIRNPALSECDTIICERFIYI